MVSIESSLLNKIKASLVSVQHSGKSYLEENLLLINFWRGFTKLENAEAEGSRSINSF